MIRHCILTGILGLCLFASVAVADPGGEAGQYTVNHDPLSEASLPELKTAPAPQWVKPGTRVIWYTASALIPSSYVSGFTEDPDGKLRDPVTGKTYSQDAAPSASGHGFTVIDIVAVHDDVVVASYATYGIEEVNGPLVMVSSGAYSLPAGYMPGLWINPTVLAKHMDPPPAGLKMSRTAYKVGGKSFDALWFCMPGDASTTSAVVDLQTGLVLHTSIASSTAASSVMVNGVSTAVGGGTQLAQTTIQNARALQIPWAGAPMPDALNRIHKLTYSGAVTTAIPGSPAVSQRCDSECVITGRGKDFLQGKRTTRVAPILGNFPPNITEADFASSSDSLSPLAIAPQLLAKLQQNQVLDQDPVTHITTVVSFVGRDQRGNDVVVISSSQAPNANHFDNIYDRNTGLLVGAVSTNVTLHITTQMYLAGQE